MLAQHRVNVFHYDVCFQQSGHASGCSRVSEVADLLEGKLVAACSDELGFKAANLRESGICVGSKEWCVFSETDRFDKLEQRVKQLEDESSIQKVDVVASAIVRLQLVATQALLLAAKAPNNSWTNFRFTKLLNTPAAAQLTKYTESINKRQVPATNDRAVANMLDDIINSRNTYVHNYDQESFSAEVVRMQSLIERYPRLQKECPGEVLVIETYDNLKQCFSF